MKKALVVLLLLAVAGGLFAQVTFTGGVYTGFGLLKKGSADLYAGTNSAWNGADGIHVRINPAFTSADGDYGFNASIRGNGKILGVIGDEADTGFAGSLEMTTAFGWMNGFNGFVKGYGGRMNTTQITGVDAWDGNFWDNHFGLQGYVYPLGTSASASTSLTIGAGVKADLGPAAGATTLDKLGYWGGAMYTADTFAVSAEVDYLKDSNTRAFLSVDFTGVSGFDIDGSAVFGHLENGDTRTMRFNEHVGILMLNNIGLDIYAREDISAVDNTDMLLGGRVVASYKAITDITPAIELAYVQGMSFSHPGLAGNQWDAATFDADQKFITVNPSVKFSTTAKSYVTLGYTLGYDLGDVPAAGDADNKMAHAIYLDYVVEF